VRILFIGENWLGSCARACSAALRRAGCDVLDLDVQTFVPQWSHTSLRLLRRLFASSIAANFNDQVLRAAEKHCAEILLAFKGNFVFKESLQILRERGVATYNYYPDRLVLARGTKFERSLPEYDCFFDTKRTWDGDMPDRLRLRDRVFVPHGYDADVHNPVALSQAEMRYFASDVSFVGTHTLRKERILDDLLKLLPGLSLRIFGNDWANCRSARLKPYIFGTAVCGQTYAKVIAASKINLAIMGVSDDVLDETTTRTFEIPACGGFMLHESSQEVKDLYREGSEIVLFENPPDLADKIQFYLANPELARRIAAAGYRRAVPAYSYDARMQTILKYHTARTERNVCQDIAC
jgi:hypothetical protein